MNTVIARLIQLVTFRLAPERRVARTRVSGLRTRRAARSTFFWFVSATVFINLGVLVAADLFWPDLRDPEYGRREKRLEARVAEHPGRPLVLALGSSRVGAAVHPREWEATRPGKPGDPLLFNMGEVGSGPLIQLLTLDRVYRSGVRPSVVLIEYWPPFLSYDDWPEWKRVDWERLYRADLPLIRAHFRDPERVEAAVTRGWLTPITTLRQRLLIQVFPGWFTWPKRFDVAWNGLDAWGYLPGVDLPVAANPERTKRLAECQGYYKERFPKYKIHPEADQNLRAVVALARKHGSQVALYWLPESSEFRSWYTPRVEKQSREYLAGLSAELGVPVIDARLWAEDFHLVDGFHLSRIGAAAFTRQLGPAILRTFPELGVKP